MSRVYTEAEQKAIATAWNERLSDDDKSGANELIWDEAWDAARDYYKPEPGDANLSPSQFMQSEADSIDATEEVAEGDEAQELREALETVDGERARNEARRIVTDHSPPKAAFAWGWDAHVAFVATLRDRDAIQVREAHAARRIAEAALTAERERRENAETLHKDSRILLADTLTKLERERERREELRDLLRRAVDASDDCHGCLKHDVKGDLSVEKLRDEIDAALASLPDRARPNAR